MDGQNMQKGGQESRRGSVGQRDRNNKVILLFR